jgi:hypothetical protein
MVETITEAAISRIIVLLPGGSRVVLDAADVGVGYSNADSDQVVLAEQPDFYLPVTQCPITLQWSL